MIAGAVLADHGTVRLDDADVRDWDADILARHIGYLPQAPSLFAGMIAENIVRFNTELNVDKFDIDVKISATAQKVGADTLVRPLSAAYDHMLTVGSCGLSADQAQCIALARGVYSDTALLILDDFNTRIDVKGYAALAAVLSALKQ